MTKLIQPSMAGGEVSAAIGARVDLAKRSIAVEIAENFLTQVAGGMESRGGQEFVARCKGTTAVRIFEFEYNIDQTFVIEMGEQYARFHTNGGQILDSSTGATISAATQADPVVVTSTGAHGYLNGEEIFIGGIVGMTQLNGRNFKVANVTSTTYELQDLNGVNVDGTGYSTYTSGGSSFKVYEIVTPYAEADLFGISYAQSGDVMTLCHPDYAPRELIRVANDQWTLSEISFEPQQPFPTELSATCNTSATTVLVSAITRADPCVVTTSTSHGILAGAIVHLTGIVGMTNLNHTLFKASAVTGNTITLANVDSGVEVDSTGFPARTSGGTIEVAVAPRQYTVTAINNDTGEESLHSCDVRQILIASITQASPCVVTTIGGHGLRNLDEIEIEDVGGMTELNGGRFNVIWISYTSFSLQRLDNTEVDSTGYTAYTSGGVVEPLFTEVISSAETNWNNSLSWAAADGASEYNVYASSNVGQFGYIGTTTKNRFDDRYIEPDYTVVPPHRRNPFDDPAATGNYNPSAVGFFDQRRIFGNTNTNPNRFFMTQIGHLYNFSRSEPTADDDAIIGSIIARRINSIRHIVPLTDLIVFTSGGEYRITGDPTLTPSSLKIKPQSYYGSTILRPIVAGEVGLFASAGGYIRDFTYQFADDKFVGRDVTVLARHLFDSYDLVDWDFAPSPNSAAWIVRDDGMMLGLTYNPEQDVYAWTRHSTRGSYKSVCVVREGSYDVPYFVVERSINGTPVQFIERQAPRRFSDLADAFCVDAGLTLDAPIAITGATAANPVVITTSAAHGLTDGDTVDISGIFEADATTTQGRVTSADYNGTGYTVANATATTFELEIEGVGVDGSGYAAYSSGGVAREAVTTLSGLWHLEGETVVAAANGYAETGLVVSGGRVTLSAPASRVHVGLPYTCRLTTLPLSTYAEGGQPVQGRAKNISRLTVQVERTMGMWYGPDVDHMREAKFGLPSLYGQPLAMVTDDIDVTMKGDWGKRKQIVIEQRSPLPMTILSLIPEVQAGGN